MRMFDIESTEQRIRAYIIMGVMTVLGSGSYILFVCVTGAGKHIMVPRN